MHIRTAKAAAAFANPRRRRMVLLLTGRELSLSKPSAATHMSLSLLHHHMRALLDLGLVRICRIERRPGRPVKIYRATAEAYFVPAALIDAPPGEAQSARLRAALERSLASGFEGVLYTFDAGGPRVRVIGGETRRTTATELWLQLRLSDEHAASLAAEFRNLLRRYEQRSREGGRAYILHAAIAPA